MPTLNPRFRMRQTLQGKIAEQVCNVCWDCGCAVVEGGDTACLPGLRAVGKLWGQQGTGLLFLTQPVAAVEQLVKQHIKLLLRC